MKYGNDSNNALGFVEKFVEALRLHKKLAKTSAEIMGKDWFSS